MAFSVVLDLEPPTQSNLVVGKVHVIGDPDKPDIAGLPGNTPQQKQAVQEKLHACHIIAWKIMCTGIAQQMTGATLRTVAKTIFKFSDYQANNVSAPLIKEFIENALKATMLRMQKEVSNYYAGPGKQNMQAGGRMGAAIKTLNGLHEKFLHGCTINRQRAEQEYLQAAIDAQIKLFKSGYDDSPFATPEEKALSRGEYVAFWYQIYFGGDLDSQRYARFLFETDRGRLAVDELIDTGK